jgi:biopolymer transport protein ExbB/TolQ
MKRTQASSFLFVVGIFLTTYLGFLYIGVSINKISAEEAIPQLGLEYQLMTQFTSFIAIWRMTVTAVSQPLLIDATDEGNDESAFDICPMGIWRSMGIVVRIVLLIHVIMSMLTIGIGLGRYMNFSAARNQSHEFVPQVASLLRNLKFDEAINLSDRYRKSHLAMLVNAGLREYRTHQLSSNISGDMIDATKRSLQRATAIKVSEFKRGLSGLATIGSTAPFVGLFGTVSGLMNAFTEMRKAETAGISAVAGGISEALFTTACGLAVAVPTVWVFKYLTRRVDNFVVEMEISSAELIDFFLKQQGKKRR